MRTVLTKDLPVLRVAVFAEMAWLAHRPELQLLCQRARDNGGRLDSATVQAVLPGLGNAGSANVVTSCQALRLCDAGGALTAIGEQVADSGDAPLPEQGVYDFWMTAHPLLGKRLLHAERLASNRDNRADALEPLPLTPDLNVAFASAIRAEERFVLRDLPTNHGKPCCVVGQTHSQSRVRWTLDFDNQVSQWQLDGYLDGPNGAQPLHVQAQDRHQDFRRLADHWGIAHLHGHGQWSASDQRLAIAATAASAEEQERFQKDFQLTAVEVPGVDTFADVTLEAVPVGPRTRQDANLWALERMRRALQRQPAARSRGAVRALFADLVEGTPLQTKDPTLPSHRDLLAATETDAPLWWSLRAAVDLSPHPIAAHELDEFALDRPVQAPQTPGAAAFVLPYHHGSTMQQVVSRLLGDCVPQQVLLCDRYVRGADNLVMLQVFADALRAVQPSVTVEVWSGDDDFDAKAVRAIAGGAARTYSTVFGRDHPHDRFVGIRPANGPGFAWILSNSPLHARTNGRSATPETPLLWKDLSAQRLSPEQLQPAMARWCKGA